MFIDNLGNINNGKGLEKLISADNQTIVHGSGTFGEVTENDFTDFMNALSYQNKDVKTWYSLTGVGGYLRISWGMWGKQKLPRKLKKRVYLTHKLRKLYLPEYYQ